MSLDFAVSAIAPTLVLCRTGAVDEARQGAPRPAPSGASDAMSTPECCRLCATPAALPPFMVQLRRGLHAAPAELRIARRSCVVAGAMLHS